MVVACEPLTGVVLVRLEGARGLEVRDHGLINTPCRLNCDGNAYQDEGIIEDVQEKLFAAIV